MCSCTEPAHRNKPGTFTFSMDATQWCPIPSRGALFPALQAIGLLPAAVRRAWAAFRFGAWVIEDLLSAWEAYILEQQLWQAHQYDGYYPIAVDLTAYWRPRVECCPSKHYSRG